MKEILMSIQPKWCELIAAGKKTVEVRKTAPKDTPFKVYMYCTKERMTRVPSMYAYLHKNEPRACAEYGTIEKWGRIGDVIVNPYLASKHVSYGMHGKVVGEFVCDKIQKIKPCFGYYSYGYDIDDDALPKTCLTRKNLMEYGKGNPLYGLHISDLKIYDKPKELGEFVTVKCTNKRGSCSDCKTKPDCIKQITRPPQGWQYVEDIGQ